MQSRDGGCLLCKKKNWLINSIWPIRSWEGVAVMCAPRRRYVCLDIPATLASCLALHVTGPAQVSWSKEFWEWGQGQGVSDTWYFFISCNELLTHVRAAWRFSIFPAASLSLWVLARKVLWPGRASPGPGLVSAALRIWVLHLKHWGPHWLLLSSDPSQKRQIESHHSPCPPALLRLTPRPFKGPAASHHLQGPHLTSQGSPCSLEATMDPSPSGSTPASSSGNSSFPTKPSPWGLEPSHALGEDLDSVLSEPTPQSVQTLLGRQVSDRLPHQMARRETKPGSPSVSTLPGGPGINQLGAAISHLLWTDSTQRRIFFSLSFLFFFFWPLWLEA